MRKVCYKMKCFEELKKKKAYIRGYCQIGEPFKLNTTRKKANA